jgi:ankyrin repeat protein
MPDHRPVPPLKRALAWILLLTGFGIWLFSDSLFPGNSRLYDAIAAGDTGQVKQLLQAGADPNSQASPLTMRRTSGRRYQMSPLAWALWNNKADVALALVEGGANPNTRDLNGHTALYLAASNHMTQVTQALAARGALPARTERVPADR